MGYPTLFLTRCYFVSCALTLQTFKVPLDDDSSLEVSFRKLLLVRCQREFESGVRDDEPRILKQEEIQRATGQQRRELEVEYEIYTKKCRKRKLGNIR